MFFKHPEWDKNSKVKKAFDFCIQATNLLSRLDSILSETLQCWAAFKSEDGDILYFNDTEATELSPRSRRNLRSIMNVFRLLDGSQKRIVALRKSCLEYKGFVSKIMITSLKPELFTDVENSYNSD